MSIISRTSIVSPRPKCTEPGCAAAQPGSRLGVQQVFMASIGSVSMKGYPLLDTENFPCTSLFFLLPDLFVHLSSVEVSDCLCLRFGIFCSDFLFSNSKSFNFRYDMIIFKTFERYLNLIENNKILHFYYFRMMAKL